MPLEIKMDARYDWFNYITLQGLNALHLGAKYGQLDSIKYLLDNCSIDVNCVASSTGNSALHYSIAHTNPTRSLQCTKLLLNRGGNHKWLAKINLIALITFDCMYATAKTSQEKPHFTLLPSMDILNL